MSYQVLARKWRPKTFREMVGQEHVLKALINALDHNRLHHAYLFTGTRGVGKTTIARILAKCLNCQVGVSSVPCGQCSACNEINEGRFIDLIEVDAASRTKVEDTRELLENVQYAPTTGRYKVYIIDEVHMLSNSSFNALLKTLEEPPPHVKFLLATTDPQKLPATVLSRCLQFNLKNMSPQRIVGHLQNVLQQEMVEFEDPALWQLGRAADGSMRDALSLTDQAIAYGNGNLSEHDVRQMLGTIDQHFVVDVLKALISHDGGAVLNAVDQLSQFAPDYAGALEELLTLLHRIAIAQAVPDTIDNSYGDAERIASLASQITAEDLQLFYQMGLNGRRDLPLNPDPRSGFEMVLLRMLAFKPKGIPEVSSVVLQNSALSMDSSTPIASNQHNVAPEVPQAVKKPEQVISTTELVDTAKLEAPVAVEPLQTQASINALPAPKHSIEDITGGGSQSVEPPAPVIQDEQNSSQNCDKVSTTEEAANNKPQPTMGRASELMNAHAAAVKGSLSAVSTPVATSNSSTSIPEPSAQHDNEPQEHVEEETEVTLANLTVENWPRLYGQLGFGGVVGNIAAHCLLNDISGDQLSFTLDENNASLFNDSYADRMQQHLTIVFNIPVNVSISIAQVAGNTPAMYREKQKSADMLQATRTLQNDDNVHMLVERFGATLDLDSVTSIH
ncbi:MAG: DNA polymerase-3 subunit gamma/tau [Pseudohongiellaceae bacterium]|jgi:DNA polymerase-3 subunit gamma/tau